jgi:uncharacterized BrkB/YihY/UPF0761 family membrane protein
MNSSFGASVGIGVGVWFVITILSIIIALSPIIIMIQLNGISEKLSKLIENNNDVQLIDPEQEQQRYNRVRELLVEDRSEKEAQFTYKVIGVLVALLLFILVSFILSGMGGGR